MGNLSKVPQRTALGLRKCLKTPLDYIRLFNFDEVNIPRMRHEIRFKLAWNVFRSHVSILGLFNEPKSNAMGDSDLSWVILWHRGLGKYLRTPPD